MGTSSSYGGPRPRGDLLPPGAPPPPPNPDETDPDDTAPRDEPDPETDNSEHGEDETSSAPAWDQTKRAMTRFTGASARGSDRALNNLGRATRGFIRNQGGSRGATASSPAGMAAGRALGGFIRDVGTLGAAEAFRQRGLDQYLGQSCDVLIAALLDQLAEKAGHSEEDLARRAMTATLIHLLEANDDGSVSMDSLDSLGEEEARSTLRYFLVEYINERLMHTLGRSAEIKAVSEGEAIAIEEQVRDFLSQRVEGVAMEMDFLSVDWNGEEGDGLIESLFSEAHEIMEVE